MEREEPQTNSAISQAASTAPNKRSEFLLWLALSSAYASMIIQYSLHYGKLAAPPFYDDVSYFVDALSRLRLLYQRDWGLIVGELLNHPPHSIFSTLLALVSYLILGTRDWAPYAGNVVIILGLAYVLNFMGRGLPLWIRLLVFVFVLTFRISQCAIYEFRPDIASALCAAAGAMMLVGRRLSSGSWHQRAAAGAMFGLAMVIKTPTFPLTMTVLVTALAWSVIVDLSRGRKEFSPRAAAIHIGQAVLPATLIMLPIYAPQLGEILHYIGDPLFGQQKDLWATPLSRGEHALYYLTGDGGQTMLGNLFPLPIGIVLVGLLLAFMRRQTEMILTLVGIVVTAIAAYVIPAIIRVKQPFFGTTFDWLVILGAVYVLFWIVRSAPTPVGASIVLLITLWAALTTRFISPLYKPEAENLLARRRVICAIYDALSAEHVQPRDRVYITTTGYVNTAVLDYFNLQKSLPAFDIQENSYSDDLKLHQAGIAAARYVIASEQGNSEAYGTFVRAGNIQDQTLALCRADRDLVEIAAIPTLNSKRYFVFRRVVAATSRTSPRGGQATR